jgi:hypothetical protein
MQVHDRLRLKSTAGCGRHQFVFEDGIDIGDNVTMLLKCCGANLLTSWHSPQ